MIEIVNGIIFDDCGSCTSPTASIEEWVEKGRIYYGFFCDRCDSEWTTEDEEEEVSDGQRRDATEVTGSGKA